MEIKVFLTKLCLEFCCFLRLGLASCVHKSLDPERFQTPSNGLAWRQGVSVMAVPKPSEGKDSTQQLQGQGAP